MTERHKKRNIGSLVEEVRKELKAWLESNSFSQIEVHVSPKDFQGRDSVKIHFVPAEDGGSDELPLAFYEKFSTYMKGVFWDFVSKVIEKVQLGWSSFRIRPAQRGKVTTEYGVFLEPRAA